MQAMMEMYVHRKDVAELGAKFYSFSKRNLLIID